MQPQGKKGAAVDTACVFAGVHACARAWQPHAIMHSMRTCGRAPFTCVRMHARFGCWVCACTHAAVRNCFSCCYHTLNHVNAIFDISCTLLTPQPAGHAHVMHVSFWHPPFEQKAHIFLVPGT